MGVWETFNSRIGFRASNGRRVKFWKGRWCGNISLREVVLMRYSQYHCQRCIGSLGVGAGWGGRLLDSRFIGHIHD